MLRWTFAAVVYALIPDLLHAQAPDIDRRIGKEPALLC
jgi:hypothetical protein